MSTDTTIVELRRQGDPVPDQTQRAKPEPAPSSRSDDVPVDDQWIELQLARAGRWRKPSWPLLCKAAERYREKRVRHSPQQPVSVAVAVQGSDDPSPTLLRRYWLAWVCSVVLHVAVVVALAAWALPGGTGEDEDAIYVIGDDRRTDVLSDPPQLLEISVPSAVPNRSSGAFSNPLSEPSPDDSPGMMPPAVALASFVEDSSGPVGDVCSFLGSGGSAMAVTGSEDSGAEFYGVKATGNRFVFLVDCSVTMSVGTRWMDALRELTAAIERLGADKSFYVIFFSDESQRMFDAQQPEPDLVPATSANIARLRSWLLTIKTGMSTQPAKSVRFALSLDPDAIYLLSDGDFEEHDPTLELLYEENRERVGGTLEPLVVVHTLSFGRHGNVDRLRDIASENGGRYVCILGHRGGSSESQRE
jgi:hypothetical protein